MKELEDNSGKKKAIEISADDLPHLGFRLPHRKRNRAAWYKVDLGKGKHALVKGGRFDAKYQITVPNAEGVALARALRRAAKVARKTARMHGTPIYIWKNKQSRRR